MNKLNALGWTSQWNSKLSKFTIEHQKIGRICKVNKTNYVVGDGENEYICQLTGKLSYLLTEEELPKTGDWVIFVENKDLNIIIEVIERENTLQRKKVGTHSDIQVLASNVDTIFIVQCLSMGININRLERTVTQVSLSNLHPILIINKVDQEQELEANQSLIHQLQTQYEVILSSSFETDKLLKLREQLQPGQTHVFIGASGVGKSSLINALLSTDQQETRAISNAVQKGKHTTTSTELFVLPNGAVVIDSPGTREFGMAIDSSEIDTTYESEIEQLTKACKFNNCTHTNEPGCKVLEALNNGTLSNASFENFQKLTKELEHFSSSRKERKSKDKQLSKLIKKHKKLKNK